VCVCTDHFKCPSHVDTRFQSLKGAYQVISCSGPNYILPITAKIGGMRRTKHHCIIFWKLQTGICSNKWV